MSRAALHVSSAMVLAAIVAAPDVAAAAETDEVCADAAEHAQVLRDQHELLAARGLLVACAQRECPAVVRSSCTEWLADVDRRIPSIVVSARAGGRDIADVRVTVDGAPQPASITAAAVPLDPGSHVVRCEADGYEPTEERIVLREGELRRAVAITLAPRAPPPAPATEAPRSRIPPAAIALGGVSALAFGSFSEAPSPSHGSDADGYPGGHCCWKQ